MTGEPSEGAGASEGAPGRAEALARLDSLEGRWWHSVDLGDGVCTNGRKSADALATELAALELPDLQGKSVLDIGAWDGFYSFEAERRGAKRVVALDYFTWSIDLDAQHGYLERRRLAGETPASWDQVPEVWKPDTLPGKACFDTAAQALGSDVESVVADFLDLDLDSLGTFDVVLFLGVLYHLTDPFGAIRRLAQVTDEVAIIETAGISSSGNEEQPALMFFPGDELLGDPTNWFAPNEAAVVAMCRAAGFSKIETRITARAPEGRPEGTVARIRQAVGAAGLTWGRQMPPWSWVPTRIVAHAWK
jgi:tRNA (mo5U34)-methyltransferase